MSQENVEVIGSAVEAWQRGDQTAAIDFWDEEIEWIPPPDDPDYAVVKGVEAATDALTKWLATWDSYRFELTALIDAGDQVLQAGRQMMDTRGAEVASEVFFVWTFRDRRAIRMQMFYRRDEALKAVGLEE
jgi:ketosteroid isomerase-like protein